MPHQQAELEKNRLLFKVSQKYHFPGLQSVYASSEHLHGGIKNCAKHQVGDALSAPSPGFLGPFVQGVPGSVAWAGKERPLCKDVLAEGRGLENAPPKRSMRHGTSQGLGMLQKACDLRVGRSADSGVELDTFTNLRSQRHAMLQPEPLDFVARRHAEPSLLQKCLLSGAACGSRMHVLMTGCAICSTCFKGAHDLPTQTSPSVSPTLRHDVAALASMVLVCLDVWQTGHSAPAPARSPLQMQNRMQLIQFEEALESCTPGRLSVLMHRAVDHVALDQSPLAQAPV